MGSLLFWLPLLRATCGHMEYFEEISNDIASLGASVLLPCNRIRERGNSDDERRQVEAPVVGDGLGATLNETKVKTSSFVWIFIVNFYLYSVIFVKDEKSLVLGPPRRPILRDATCVANEKRHAVWCLINPKATTSWSAMSMRRSRLSVKSDDFPMFLSKFLCLPIWLQRVLWRGRR